MKQLERKIELLETILEGKIVFEANYKAQKLDYNPNSLSDFIDKETMDVHYNGHYKTYIKKLNDLLPDDKTIPIEVLIKKISRYNRKVRNNAGGVYNHQLFWKMLSPNKTKPSEELLDKIIKDLVLTMILEKSLRGLLKINLVQDGFGWLLEVMENFVLPQHQIKITLR